MSDNSVYAISDLHLSLHFPKPMDVFGDTWVNYWQDICEDWQQKVKPDDIVLLGGDISWAMALQHALLDIYEISALNGIKVLVKGNHDYWWKSISAIRAALPEKMYVLQNDSVRLGNKLICGTRGWIVPESDTSSADIKIYNREVIRLNMSLDNMSRLKQDGDITICLMHFPPFNSRREQNQMTQLISQHNIDKVVYGHLHGKDCRSDLKLTLNNTEYYLTSCDQVKNKLVKIV